MIPFLRIYIEESFLDAVYLKYTDVVEFILSHGLHIEDNPKYKHLLVDFIKSCHCIAEDPPTNVLEILL